MNRAEMAQVSVSVVPWTPPVEGVPDRPHGEEASAKIQEMLGWPGNALGSSSKS